MAKQRLTPEFYEAYTSQIHTLQQALEGFSNLLPELPLTKATARSATIRLEKLTEKVNEIQTVLDENTNRPLSKTEIRETLSRANTAQIEQISSILKE